MKKVICGMTVAALLAFACVLTPKAFAQGDESVAALKRELETLKSEVKMYADTSAALEARLKMLEQQAAAEKKIMKDVMEEAKPAEAPQTPEAQASDITASAPEVAQIAEKTQVEFLQKLAAKAAMDSQQVLFKQPDYLPNYLTKGLEFHGYFRSGYGMNSKGGKMQAFQAPDALAKYRLGNEQETYIETIFLNRNWNPDPEGVTLLTQIRVAYTTQQNQTSDDFNQIDLREMYGRMGNFVEWDRDIKVWAGQRFCRLPETRYQRLLVVRYVGLWRRLRGYQYIRHRQARRYPDRLRFQRCASLDTARARLEGERELQARRYRCAVRQGDGLGKRRICKGRFVDRGSEHQIPGRRRRRCRVHALYAG